MGYVVASVGRHAEEGWVGVEQELEFHFRTRPAGAKKAGA